MLAESFILIPLANSQHNLYDINLLLCIQYETPNDGQITCPKNVEFYSKINEILVHLVGFIIRIYHDPRSSECHMHTRNDFTTGWLRNDGKTLSWNSVFERPCIETLKESRKEEFQCYDLKVSWIKLGDNTIQYNTIQYETSSAVNARI